MRTFELHRMEDESGVSGTGIVAQGVMFGDGTIAMRWLTAYRSTALYASVQDLVAIHGHKGKTRVRWLGAFGRGLTEAALDKMENVGRYTGNDKRDYLLPHEEDEFKAGYEAGYREAADYQGSLIQ